MYLLLRLLINAGALWAATMLVPGISFVGGTGRFLVVALIFGLLNALVRPILLLLSLPLLILTLGLFTFVLNALILMLLGALSGSFGLGFQVAGFFPAFVGALIVTVVSLLLSMLVKPATDRR
ncbi:MAG: phage holin family protein [Acidobacteriota bacterium]|nr:phage holin family protein [Acidobacteriota bacterium]